MKKHVQPSGLTIGLEFLIDSDWTPEQAWAVIELLDDLRDRILAYYQLPIMELLRDERGDNSDDPVETVTIQTEDESQF